MSNLIYNENSWPEFGVSHQWVTTTVKSAFTTEKGTQFEIIERPRWGLACYMDNAIQSCEADEYIYHESLVHPVMFSSDSPKRIMIIGGGEGATAREVLKWPSVEHVDMYEWDKDVILEFKEKYPQWAKGAWDDKRLSVYCEDIFTVIQRKPEKKYDVIIIDLFEPTDETKMQWITLLRCLENWVTPHGSIGIYTGIRNIFKKSEQYTIMRYIYDNIKVADNYKLMLNRIMIQYKVYIPSFSGESMFLLIKHISTSHEIDNMYMKQMGTHLTNDIWKSYQVYNY
jgi:spermidine synthase